MYQHGEMFSGLRCATSIVAPFALTSGNPKRVGWTPMKSKAGILEVLGTVGKQSRGKLEKCRNPCVLVQRRFIEQSDDCFYLFTFDCLMVL